MNARRRRAVYTTVLGSYFVLSVVHPVTNPAPGDDTRLWLALHVVQLGLIGGLAAVLWLLVDGVTSRAATFARTLTVPFVIAYTTLDAVLGLAWGVAARSASMLPPRDREGGARLVEHLLASSPEGYVLYAGAGLSWFAAASATALALPVTVPRAARWLLYLGAGIFAIGHAPPTGPVGIALVSAGVLVLERQRSKGFDPGQRQPPSGSCPPATPSHAQATLLPPGRRAREANRRRRGPV